MGRDVDLYVYNSDKLISKFKEKGIENIELLRNILSECGLFFNGSYIILNNEFWEDGNPYFNCANLIDSAFNLEDSFDVLLNDERDGYRKEGINYADKCEISDKLGFELKED